eukprot:TRINITY_DN7962_c0_g2_i1.p2 TRINITY_DN7962_c0_g2~~TRINITY_DN7962_c0_g2_i1.p2  ORF type:complete len:194 (-),score=8.01 TRINITY_DN7962_c0_g2_i1:329-910(-)
MLRSRYFYPIFLLLQCVTSFDGFFSNLQGVFQILNQVQGTQQGFKEVILDIGQMRQDRGDAEGATRMTEFSQWANIFGTKRSLTALTFDMYRAQEMLTPIVLMMQKIIDKTIQMVNNRSGYIKIVEVLQKEVYDVFYQLKTLYSQVKGTAAHNFIKELIYEFQDEYFLTDVCTALYKIIFKNFGSDRRGNQEL